jgi:spore cortex formation protein SpoVR/YcgB (stage V sporulation)
MSHRRDEIDQMKKESIQELLKKLQTLWRNKVSLTIVWREESLNTLTSNE